jgi:hypothetical protein
MKKLLIAPAILLIIFAIVGGVGAQDTTPQPTPFTSTVGAFAPIRTVIEIVSSETGIDPKEIMQQLAEGMTLADIIESNNGNVQLVIDQSVAKITANVNQSITDGKLTQARADQLLANLSGIITKAVNGDLFPNKLDRGAGAVRRASERILVQATADATKLSPVDIIKQLRDGKTLAEVITAQGANVDTVVSAAVAKATEQINTAVNDGRLGQVQADNLIANLQKLYTAAVNGDTRIHAEKMVVGLAVLRFAAEQTGLKVADIVTEIRGGKSLADVLGEHNIDTTTFISGVVAAAKNRLDKAVANGRMTQNQADKKLEQLQQRLTERITQIGGAESTPQASVSG